MKLTPLEIDILRAIRERIETVYPGDSYLCLLIADEGFKRREQEKTKLINRTMFWREAQITEKWHEQISDLRSGVMRGINFKSTVGEWFEAETAHLKLNLPDGFCKNDLLYRMIRMAWLERIIETGEIK